jgi:hypothetical protein
VSDLSPEPEWYEDPEKLAAFAAKLKADPSLAEVFTSPSPAGPEPKAKAPTSGGGESVPANQMQERASDLVAAITKAAIAEGRREGSGTVTAAPATSTAAPPPPVPKISAFGKWLFGEVE